MRVSDDFMVSRFKEVADKILKYVMVYSQPAAPTPLDCAGLRVAQRTPPPSHALARLCMEFLLD